MTDAPRCPRRTVLRGAALGGVAAFIAACTGTRPSSAAPAPPRRPPRRPAAAAESAVGLERAADRDRAR